MRCPFFANNPISACPNRCGAYRENRDDRIKMKPLLFFKAGVLKLSYQDYIKFTKLETYSTEHSTTLANG